MAQREFTPQEFAQYAEDALENWDWDIEAKEGRRSEKYIADMKEALTFDAEYAVSTFADDGGVIRLDRAYGDVYDKLYEFAKNCADNAADSR